MPVEVTATPAHPTGMIRVQCRVEFRPVGRVLPTCNAAVPVSLANLRTHVELPRVVADQLRTLLRSLIRRHFNADPTPAFYRERALARLDPRHNIWGEPAWPVDPAFRDFTDQLDELLSDGPQLVALALAPWTAVAAPRPLDEFVKVLARALDDRDQEVGPDR